MAYFTTLFLSLTKLNSRMTGEQLIGKAVERGSHGLI